MPEKSFLATWLFALLLGFFAVDRFYLGKIGTAILKLVTFGGFGVWVLVDLILVLAGKQTDKLGRPLEGYDRLKVIAWIVTGAVILVSMIGGAVNRGSAATTSVSDVVVMPALLDERLDIALSDLGALGVDESDVEIIGGDSGLIVDQSEWFVCEQRPAAAEPIVNVRLIVELDCNAAAEPEAPTAEPVDPSEGFASSASANLDDLSKDFNDIIVTLDEEGFWRLLSNSIEVSFNIGQLQALTPPAEVAADWATQFGALEAASEVLTDSIAEDAAPDTIRANTNAAIAQLAVVQSVVDRVAP